MFDFNAARKSVINAAFGVAYHTEASETQAWHGFTVVNALTT
jgi:hypothetical protein